MAEENTPVADETRQAPSEQAMPQWFIKTVGLLLLVIIAALTGLMLRFRHEAKLAEAEVRQLRSIQSQPNPSLEALLQKLNVAMPSSAPAPEPTDD